MSVSLLVPEKLIETYFPSNCHFRDFVKKKLKTVKKVVFPNLNPFTVEVGSNQPKILNEHQILHEKSVSDHFWGLIFRKIQKCAKEFDVNPIIKMFDHLKAKIRKADQHGLRSLTKK